MERISVRPHLSEAEILRRLPLWIAFSDLYLDTETGDSTYAAIARACHQSGYARQELRAILFDEVGPAFCGNLLQVAGEWAMFSAEEVELALRKQRLHHRKFPWPFRRMLTRYTEEQWCTVEHWLDRPPQDLAPPPAA